jgi:CBS domain-containing protein
MWEHDIGALPVVDDKGHLVGVITDRDVAMAAYLREEPLRAIPVHTVMAQHVHACRADDEVSTVEATMAQYQLHRIPVIDEGRRPIGMITLNDIARDAGSYVVSNAEVVSTLTAICEPRGVA